MTSAVWTVRPGRERDFEEAWAWHLGVLRALPRPIGEAGLWRSATDARTYFSWGEWDDEAAVEAMAASPRAPEVVARMGELCEAIDTSSWRPVARLTAPGGAGAPPSPPPR